MATAATAAHPPNVVTLRNSLADADPSQVVAAFTDLRPHFAARQWLGPSNHYRSDTVKKLEDTSKPIRHKDLRHYIASSVVLHASDGWCYLGQAMQATLVGEPAVARHLAYYAQLRAAMSILAANGIGIFNGRHFLIANDGKTKLITPRMRTHTMVWHALSWWAEQQAAADLLGSAFGYDGTSLREWLDNAGLGSWTPVGQEWVETLIFDLGQAEKDQESRNEASYRPVAMTNAVPAPPCEDARLVRDIWRAFEPGGLSGFDVIQRHLLRLILERGITAAKAPASLADRNTEMRTAINLAFPAHAGSRADDRLRRFLLRRDERKDLLVLKLAKERSTRTHPRHHHEMLCRAGLLLQLANGSAAEVVAGAAMDFDDLDHWWRRLGDQRGLWVPDPSLASPDVNDVIDLWADIADDLELIDDWLNGANSDRLSLLHSCSTAYPRLTSTELIGMWGLPA